MLGGEIVLCDAMPRDFVPRGGQERWDRSVKMLVPYFTLAPILSPVKNNILFPATHMLCNHLDANSNSH